MWNFTWSDIIISLSGNCASCNKEPIADNLDMNTNGTMNQYNYDAFYHNHRVIILSWVDWGTWYKKIVLNIICTNLCKLQQLWSSLGTMQYSDNIRLYLREFNWQFSKILPQIGGWFVYSCLCSQQKFEGWLEGIKYVLLSLIFCVEWDPGCIYLTNITKQPPNLGNIMRCQNEMETIGFHPQRG